MAEHELIPAWLHDYRRVRAATASYPVLVHSPGVVVGGVVFRPKNERDDVRIRHFEDAEYAERWLCVHLAGGHRIPARVFFALEALPPSDEPWDLATWRRRHKREFLEHEVTGKALTGRKEYSVLERIWALPTLEIHGIRGGFTGEGAKTVIPAAGVAKVSLRLVPGNTFEATLAALGKAVSRLAPKWAEVEVRPVHGSDPVLLDISHPAFAVLDAAFAEVVGRGTVPVRAGGSIPVVSRLASGGAPVLLTGIGLPDDGLHSPNEKVELQQVWDGVRVFGRFMELLAAGPA